MKMTLHIDDSLLQKAMEIAGVGSKTSAVDLALREFVRRGELVEILKTALKRSPEELHAMFEPEYDLAGARLNEKPTRYGRKPGAR